MAAAAYDVAALALKGPETTLNFPDSIPSYPIPASLSSTDIRAAAEAAAQTRIMRVTPPPPSPQQQQQQQQKTSSSGFEGSSSSAPSGVVQEYIDEDELLNMPNLLDEMARGMQVSPPRMSSFSNYSSDDSPRNSDGGDNLWSYNF
jgi:hypothetical protein